MSDKPDEIDPLPLLAAVADDMADILLRFFTQEEYRVERPEFERMRQVQRLLMLNAHPVPRNVDAVVEAARTHGGLSP